METELETLKKITDTASEFIVNYGFQLFGALIILIAGWFVAKWAAGVVLKICQRAGLDITLSRFFSTIAKVVVLCFVLIIALGKFGITIAPFIAALGAVAFGSTLAFQGPLSNYGAGLTIILTRPFTVGDTIKVQDVIGVVENIKMAYTQLSTEDGELITIPNKHIVGEIIHNTYTNLVVESTIGISYECNSEDAIAIIRDVLNNNTQVTKDPAPQAGVQNFGDSSIEIGYRYWVPTKQYYQTLYSVNAAIYSRFKEQGIVIPYPQREVKLINQ